MPCEWIKLPGGGTAIVKVSGRRYPKCKFCAQRLDGLAHDGCLTQDATLLCDHEIGRTLGGEPITCDAKICVLCAQRVGDKDFCPNHRVKGK